MAIVDEEAGISELILQIVCATDPKETLRLVERLGRQVREHCLRIMRSASANP